MTVPPKGIPHHDGAGEQWTDPPERVEAVGGYVRSVIRLPFMEWDTVPHPPLQYFPNDYHSPFPPDSVPEPLRQSYSHWKETPMPLSRPIELWEFRNGKMRRVGETEWQDVPEVHLSLDTAQLFVDGTAMGEVHNTTITMKPSASPQDFTCAVCGWQGPSGQYDEHRCR